MASTKVLKRRIKASKNISQITKAMEMVAAAKMRKAQAKALASRPYATRLDSILRRMSGLVDPEKHLLLQKRTPLSGAVNTAAVLLISPDKGLCGSLTSNLFRQVDALEKTVSREFPQISLNFQFITVGKKAREHVLKTGRALHAEFSSIPDRPAYEDILPIANILLSGYTQGRFFTVYLLFTNFLTTISQKPQFQQILPIVTLGLNPQAELNPELTPESYEYVFEPDSETILNWLLPYYFELQIYQTILEAQAAEHSARMVAMRNASENARDIIRYLQLEYNRKRQSLVTTEIADIVVSRMAVN